MHSTYGVCCHTLAVSAYTSSLSLFLQSLQKDHHSLDLLELSNFGNQEQKKGYKMCDQKIYLITEQRKLSQLNEELFREFLHRANKVEKSNKI